MLGSREGPRPGLGVSTACGLTTSLPSAPAGFKRWLSSPVPAPRVCVVGSGPAGFYTAQHILKVPGWDLAAGEGRDLPAEGGTSLLPGSKGVGERFCGLPAPFQPALWCWGAAWGSPDPTGSSLPPSPGVGAAAPVAALPLGHPGRTQAWPGCCEFSPRDFSGIE